jgi:SAM-dependent methyltransferase
MVKKLLKYSNLYNFSMNIMGSKKSRKIFINDYVLLSEHSRVLDLGCGPADILNFLTPFIDYTGIDASSNYISAAKNKFPDQKFICTIFDSNTKLDGKFDVVLAVGLIHHLNDETSRNLIVNASKVLNDGGQFITLDNVLYNGQSWLNRWIIKQDRGDYIRNLREYTSLFPQDKFSQIQFDLREDLLRIPYSHVVSICTK